MINYLLCLLSFATIIFAFTKFNRRKSEWMLLLIMLVFAQASVSFLFTGSDVLPLFSIAGVQVHLKDVIMLIALVYLVYILFNKIIATRYTFSLLLLLIPLLISIFRGILAGTMGSAGFFADVRKYISFFVVLCAFYFLMRSDAAYERLYKYKEYIDKLMTVVYIYTCIIWFFDLVLGMHDLPGQYEGTLSDGGSTLRIIAATQVFVIALYTLYMMYNDLMENNKMSIRTMAFSAMIILFQWRTVVAAFLICAVFIVVLTFKKNGISNKLFGQFLLIAASVVLLLAVGAGNITAMITNLFESFTSVKNGTGTFSTRTDVWKMILGTLEGVKKIVGNPFGQKLNISWQHSAHSTYIDWASKMGYLGLVLLVAFMLNIFIKAYKQKKYLIMIFLISISVFWMAYGLSIEQGAVIGTMLAMVEHDRFKSIENNIDNIDYRLNY